MRVAVNPGVTKIASPCLPHLPINSLTHSLTYSKSGHESQIPQKTKYFGSKCRKCAGIRSIYGMEGRMGMFSIKKEPLMKRHEDSRFKLMFDPSPIPPNGRSSGIPNVGQLET